LKKLNLLKTIILNCIFTVV